MPTLEETRVGNVPGLYILQACLRIRPPTIRLQRPIAPHPVTLIPRKKPSNTRSDLNIVQSISLQLYSRPIGPIPVRGRKRRRGKGRFATQVAAEPWDYMRA